jgi:hypothetical protein
MGEHSMTVTELEVEIAWALRDLTNAEQNDNPQMVRNLESRISKLRKELEEAKEQGE